MAMYCDKCGHKIEKRKILNGERTILHPFKHITVYLAVCKVSYDIDGNKKVKNFCFDCAGLNDIFKNGG